MSWKINETNIYAELKVKNWLQFIENIENNFIDHKEYLFRGHRDSSWKLESTFDRKYRDSLTKIKPELQVDFSYKEILSIHLKNFKKNSIGKRINPNKKLKNKEWWALGQHYGLETPLLDWTPSPYIALYFALFNPTKPKSKYRTLWIFSPLALQEIAINQEPESEFIELIDSPVDENIRLLSQRGKFTKTPNGDTIEDFLEKNIKLQGSHPVLFRIDIPENLRELFLRHLNSMNINHSTIFPDLTGASELTNRELEILIYYNKWRSTPEFQQRLYTLDYLCHH
ncbi:FRG domain-containing protein [Tenacibaculum ascidiaceicola]|uniref:FRG domain-containing protein n=1 Tax=Tenacibaculum ascidiaceicola TaxID=1699411 RepID=UPI003CE55895